MTTGYEQYDDLPSPIVIETRHGKFAIKAQGAGHAYLESLSQQYHGEQNYILINQVEYSVSAHLEFDHERGIYRIHRYPNGVVESLYMSRRGSFSQRDYTDKAKKKCVALIEDEVIPQWFKIATETGQILKADRVYLKNRLADAARDLKKATDAYNEAISKRDRLTTELAEAKDALDIYQRAHPEG